MGLSQEQLAEKAGVRQPLVSRVENGLGCGRVAGLAIWQAVERCIPLEVILMPQKDIAGRPGLSRSRMARGRARAAS
jgi:predicted XRE-type DNA-binding protein